MPEMVSRQRIHRKSVQTHLRGKQVILSILTLAVAADSDCNARHSADLARQSLDQTRANAQFGGLLFFEEIDYSVDWERIPSPYKWDIIGLFGKSKAIGTKKWPRNRFRFPASKESLKSTTRKRQMIFAGRPWTRCGLFILAGFGFFKKGKFVA
jgi:hypothetical protein